MPQIINSNIVSLNAQRNLSNSQSALSTAMQRLSSGLRVNSAKDDAAGLAIAERMSAQTRGMNVAIRNANDGISLTQTAEGALGKVADSLQRMRELSVQSANATNNTSDRESLDKEFGELSKEIQRVLGGTSFNGQKVLASTQEELTFQVGANNSENDTISVAMTDLTEDATITAVTGEDPSAEGATYIASAATATSMIDKIDTALDTVNEQRATMGASQARFEAVISNLQIGVENQSAARSRIMDTDYAAETANQSRANILQQAGNAMVAQANQLPAQVLQLLR